MYYNIRLLASAVDKAAPAFRDPHMSSRWVSGVGATVLDKLLDIDAPYENQTIAEFERMSRAVFENRMVLYPGYPDTSSSRKGGDEGDGTNNTRTGGGFRGGKFWATLVVQPAFTASTQGFGYKARTPCECCGSLKHHMEKCYCYDLNNIPVDKRASFLPLSEKGWNAYCKNLISVGADLSTN